MRLVTFREVGRSRCPGVLLFGDQVVDLSEDFLSLHEVVAGGDAALGQVRRMVDGDAPRLDAGAVELLAPLPDHARNLFATGWNYVDHFDEGAGRAADAPDFPEHPTFFTKLSSTVIASGAPVPHDADLSDRLDYEAELAVVIGLQGRNIPRDRALEHVFGYTIANDVTARDIQRSHGGQWFRGKSLDRTCPLGPAIVTADEIPDPQDLVVRCEVNGEVRQEANTATMAFSVAELIAELSRGLTLFPGDVLLTGTPSGVGYARTPPRFLAPGDEVVASISGLGDLRNPVVAEDLTSYRCA
jgi:2,4-diketo-3-deoxy-L-fuconate hydrolase